MTARQLLDGVRVVDFSEYLPGPVATQILADLGADVVKVERPGGDPVRGMMPGFLEATTRGKRSVALDLKHAGGHRAALALVAGADVVVEGWRPGVAARLGLDAESLRTTRPDLVYCSLSGYGQAGPREREPGHDLNYLGLAGGLAVPGGLAASLGTLLPIADTLGGVFAACAIAAALRRGGPCTIDLSLAESVLAGLGPLLSEHVARDRPPLADFPPRPGHEIFVAADGRPIVMGATEDHFFAGVCTILGLDDLLGDPGLATFEGRQEQAHRIHRAMAEAIAGRPAEDWLAAFARENLPVSAANDFDAALADEQFAAREAFLRVPDGEPPQVRVGFPARIDGVRPGDGLPGAPQAGADSWGLLAAAGFGPGELEQLVAEGAVVAPQRHAVAAEDVT
jgi:crotonobetainyl-CoA:carnitine CoA-transferase CaiB-like acyl-CoA transferase